ncbi:MAG: pyroglutamyl-peptidase [Candidatus Latescibacterota bacterium]
MRAFTHCDLVTGKVGIAMPKILLTGFEPWDHWSHNPSGDIAMALNGEMIGGCDIVSAILPVVHGEDIAIVKPLIAAHKPLAVVSLGLHGSASVLHIERVAVNLKMVGGADHPVVDGGPDAYFATLPTRQMVMAIEDVAHVPAKLTYSAGTFLCNHIMYRVLHHVFVSGLDVKSGFIHLPPTPDMVLGTGKTSMALADMQRGVVAALQVIAEQLNVSAI